MLEYLADSLWAGTGRESRQEKYQNHPLQQGKNFRRYKHYYYSYPSGPFDRPGLASMAVNTSASAV